MTTTEVNDMKISKGEKQHPDYLMSDCGYYYQLIDKNFDSEVFDETVARRLGEESEELGRPIVINTTGIKMKYVNIICQFIIDNTGYKAVFGRRMRIENGNLITIGFKILVGKYDYEKATE